MPRRPGRENGRAARPLVAAAGARDCAPPAVAVAGTHGAPLRSTNPATTGCPAAAAGGRRSQPCESRGEWRGHSSGRRVVAASVPTASAPAPSALAAEYQPGYDGLPGGAQGLRALRIDDDQDLVVRVRVGTLPSHSSRDRSTETVPPFRRGSRRHTPGD